MESVAVETGTNLADPVAVENGGGSGPFAILCDHASNRFPAEYRFLGLAPADRKAHIAWDPGALGVSRQLARALDAPLVFSTVSRLLVDCNRAPDAPDLIPELSETTPIPGNAKLGDAERERRIARYHAPYHAAIDDLVRRRTAAGRKTALVAIHSFTPVYRGVARPWEIGVLFDRDRTLADILIEGLRRDGLNVGVNEPYSPADRVYYTLSRHADQRGLQSVMIEIRNDLVRGERAEAAWADRLGSILFGTKHANESDVRPVAQAGVRSTAGRR